MKKINKVERLRYSGGILGMLFGSTKGKMQDKITEMNTRLSSAEATWQMAENLYRTLADQVREHSYDIKDLNR